VWFVGVNNAFDFSKQNDEMQTTFKQNNEIIISRLLKILELRTLGELAESVGYTSGNAITNWKTRGVDLNRVLNYHPHISLDYLISGIGEPFTNTPKITHEPGESVNYFSYTTGNLLRKEEILTRAAADLEHAIKLFKGYKDDAAFSGETLFSLYEGITRMIKKAADSID
jgi:hypothetical protein